MKFQHAWWFGGILSSSVAWAVYAPVPEQEQGKALTVALRAGVSYDSNIFGASTSEIGSTVFTASPRIAFNASLTPQTFFSSSYRLTVDHFTDRPGDQTLDSHEAMLRLAHQFSADTTIDVVETFVRQRNPESLLAGLPVNSDQSFSRNQLDGRFATKVAQKTELSLKGRTVLYRYENARLGTSLDRTENLLGLAATYPTRPNLRLAAEYRYQTIDYRHSGSNKDKQSSFGLIGGDYDVAQKVSASTRLGFEHRRRENETSETAPYIELSVKYDYAPKSYLTAGYVYTFEEASNVAVYTDTQVNRLFANVEHAVTALIVASGSFTYEPSQLQARRGFADADETTRRAGVAVSYLPTKNWVISASYDHDRVSSDDVSRQLRRNRVGLMAIYTF